MLPTEEENLAILRNAKVFTKLDVVLVFHVIHSTLFGYSVLLRSLGIFEGILEVPQKT